MTPEARQFVIDSIAGPINEAEFQAARSSAAAEWARRDPVSFWLDADTYRIQDPNTDAKLFENVTLADVNSYAVKAKNQPLASVLISAQPAKP